MNKEEISQLYKEYHVPEHVIAHMKSVAKVCESLADALIKKGHEVNKDMLLNAALLHDLLRLCDFKKFEPNSFPQKVTGKDIEIWEKLRKEYGEMGHVKAGAKVLKEIDEHEISVLIEKHAFYAIDNLNNWEEKILYYADKRVNGDEIVDLETRFNESRKRNIDDSVDLEKLMKYEKKVKILEEEFIKIIGYLPV